MEFEKALGEKGAFLLEAPITGGLEALRKGQMAVWVAGDKATFKAVGTVRVPRLGRIEIQSKEHM